MAGSQNRFLDMTFLADEQLFYLPLKAGISPVFSVADIQLEDWYVGDQANELLRVFSDPSSLSFDRDFFPVVLHGGSGTGKTALAISLANRMASDAHGESACCHLPSVDFARGLAEAIHTKSVDAFFDRILGFQAILIDHLDGLLAYSSALVDFASFLDRLRELKIPCFITCSAPPELLAGCPDSITSRLSSGLSIALRPPGFKARLAILELLYKKYALPVDLAEIDSLAASHPISFPALNRLVVYMKNDLSLGPLSREPAPLMTSTLSACDSSRSLLDLICSVVADHFDLLPEYLTSSSRKHTTVLARSVAIFLSRKLFSLNYSLIGEYFGGRDHSTILHAYRKIAFLCDSNPDFSRVIDSLWSRCYMLRSSVTPTAAVPG